MSIYIYRRENVALQILLAILLAIGLFQIAFGIVGPEAAGANFSSGEVVELGLPDDAETHTRLAMIYAESVRGQYIGYVFAGAIVSLLSAVCLWEVSRKSVKPWMKAP